jgi:hypothetical protein
VNEFKLTMSIFFDFAIRRPPHLTLHAVGGFKLAKVRGPDGLKMLQILANFWGIRYP